MLNCSTCHKKKPETHFYANPSHRAHIPQNASPEDGEALARLIADGLVSDTTAKQTNTAAHATLARARETLAARGRPPESEAQRQKREAAQRAAQEEAEAQAQADRIGLWGLGITVGAVVLGGAYAMWRGAQAASGA